MYNCQHHKQPTEEPCPICLYNPKSAPLPPKENKITSKERHQVAREVKQHREEMHK